MKALFLLAVFATAAPVSAAQLVQNGGFETLTNGPGQIGYSSQNSGYTEAAGWTSDKGYNFVLAPGTADGAGAVTINYGCCVSFWSTANGGLGNLPATSPAGGNFLVSDSAFNPDGGKPQDQGEPITQLISGLTIGKAYNLKFYWAAGQQQGFTGDTWSSWQVKFGNQSNSTGAVNNPSHDFQPWRLASMTFTAQSTSELLQFVAKGGPEGLPPFAFLDGVSLNAAVPEPASWAMLLIGFGLVGASARRRKHAVAA